MCQLIHWCSFQGSGDQIIHIVDDQHYKFIEIIKCLKLQYLNYCCIYVFYFHDLAEIGSSLGGHQLLLTFSEEWIAHVCQ